MRVGIGAQPGAGGMYFSASAASVLTGPAQNVAGHEIISTGNGAAATPEIGTFIAAEEGEVTLMVTTLDAAPATLTVNGTAASLIGTFVAPGTGSDVIRGIYVSDCISGSNTVSCTVSSGFIAIYGVSYTNLNVRSVSITTDSVDPPANGQTASVTVDVPADTIALASFDGEENYTNPTGWADLGEDGSLGFYWQVAGWYYNSDSAGDGPLTGATLSQPSSQFLNGSTMAAYVLSSALPPQILAPEPYTDGAIYPRVGGTTLANIAWSGVYSGGTFGSIEARVVEKTSRLEIVGWQVFDATPSGGAFSGTISVPETVLSTTEDYVTEFRWSGDTSITASQSNGWMVGPFVVMYGQSNMGLRPSAVGATAPTAFSRGGVFVNAYSFAQGAAGAISYSTVSAQAGVTGLINGFIAAADRPIAVVNAGVPGRSSDNLANGTGWTAYYLDITDAAASFLGQQPEAIFFHQGEENVAQSDIARADYLTDLNTIRAGVAARNSGSMTTNDVLLTISGLGSSLGSEAEATWHSFCEMVASLETEVGIGYAGGNRGVALADTIHWTGDIYYLDSTRHGRRMANLMGYSASGNPIFQVASAVNQTGTVVRVSLTHSLGSDFTPTTGIAGFEVYDGTTWTAATGARVDGSTIDLTHTAAGTVTAIRAGWDLDPIPDWPTDNAASGGSWLEHTQNLSIT